jgi:methionyl-tRNA formyltransferase
VTQPDKPIGRDQRIAAPPVKAAIVERALPILQPERLKRGDAVAEIRALAPDVIVVVAYGQILPRAVLEIPRVACLNLHASLLPRHRGAAPIQAAIAAGDLETGITVMYMDEGLDTGDILLQSRVKITADATGGTLHDKLGEIAPAALFDALALLAAGTAPRVPQNSAEATYAPKLEREHGKIDWSAAAEVIERKIRAYDPWPGAFMLLADAAGRIRKLRLFAAQIAAATNGTPGTIHVSSECAVIVQCGQRALSLGDVQLDGKRAMTAAEFVRGHSWIASATAG